MVPDPKWLEILKASNWQTAAIAVASGLLVYGNAEQLLPIRLEPWMIQAAVVALVVSSCLSLAGILSTAVKSPQGPRAKLGNWFAQRRAKREVTAYIPHMTAKERQIIAYLLAKNQKMFTNTMDGGYANTLISRGIVVRALRPGQAFTDFDVPFEVPTFAWCVFVKYRADFPYTPPTSEGEPHPWRVHWMVR